MQTVLKYFLFLSKSRKQIPGYKSILLSFHRLPWFGISLGKSALRSFLRREQWILPCPNTDTSVAEDEKKFKLTESSGALYELLTTLEISYHEFQNIEHTSSNTQQTLLLKTLRYRKELAELSRFFDISHAFVPQGFFLDAYEISRLCSSLNIPCLMIENTFLPDRVLVEPLDQNYYIGKQLSSFHKKRSSKITRISKEKIDSLVRQHTNKPKSNQHKSKGGNVPAELGGYILFLGQVYTDASLLFNQNEFSKNVISLIREVIRISKNLNKPVVLKLHPKENHGSDPVLFRPYENLTHRKLLGAGIKESPNDKIFIDHTDRWSTYNLIEKSTLAVTINSQSGLEAMLLGKELICCGNSYYENLQSCNSVRDNKSLESTIKKVVVNGVKTNDQSECWNFFDFIRNDYFIQKHPTKVFPEINRRLKVNFYKT